MLCTKFGKIWNSGSREKINYVEMLQTVLVGRADRQTDRQTGGRRTKRD